MKYIYSGLFIHVLENTMCVCVMLCNAQQFTTFNLSQYTTFTGSAHTAKARWNRNICNNLLLLLMYECVCLHISEVERVTKCPATNRSLCHTESGVRHTVRAKLIFVHNKYI